MKNIFFRLKNKLEFYLKLPFSIFFVKDVLIEFNEDWFRNKRVAIIGGADSVLKNKLGKTIDSYDVVVRINKGVEVLDEQHEYTGCKTDILFHCLFEDISNGGSPITPSLWKKHKVGTIIFSHNYRYTPYAFDYFFSFLKKTNKKIKISQVSKKLYFNNMNITKPLGPTTGFIAINTIFNCSPKEIYITGITFFKTPHNKLYRNMDAKKMASIKMDDFHNTEIEYQHIKKLYLNNKNIIKPDSILEQIFLNN